MRGIAIAGYAAALLFAGCGSDGGGEPPAADAMSAPEPDALAQCFDQAGIEFGVCQLVDETPCTGASDPGQRFVALADDGSVPAILGFQGLYMYALAIRTSGIHPGDEGVPAELPSVDVGLFDEADEFVSSYQRQVAFVATAGDATVYEMLSVYLVVGSGTELLGKTLTARGTVVDKDGTTKCGSRRFVGGML